LAALLFPVFALARENARRSSCQSNLKQVGLALLQYAQDYDERLPIGWQNSRPTPFGGWAELLQPYLKSLEVYQCPSEATKYNPLDSTDYTDYAYNATLGRNINNSTYEGIQLSALTDVARTVTFFDSLGHTGSNGQGCGVMAVGTVLVAMLVWQSLRLKRTEGQRNVTLKGRISHFATVM
jgi:hypothetical protein